eukprot:g4417.t1
MVIRSFFRRHFTSRAVPSTLQHAYSPGTGLSKSRMLAGSQCPKRLWFRVQEPDAVELIPSIEAKATMEAGNRVGAAAIAAISGGIEIKYDKPQHMIEATRLALSDSNVSTIYEASFSQDGIFVSVDILERACQASNSWNIIEVKSTASVKKHHILDTAIQLHVLEKSGMKIERAEVMHLNTKFGTDEEVVIPLESFSSRLKLNRISVNDICRLDRSKIESMRYRNLQRICKVVGIKANGKHEILVSKICQWIKENSTSNDNKKEKHPLFLRVDVTAAARKLCPNIPNLSKELRSVLSDSKHPPIVEPGSRCKKPYVCEFFERCNRGPKKGDCNVLPGSVVELYRASPKLLKQLHDRQIFAIKDIPRDINLSSVAKRQHAAFTGNTPIRYDKPVLDGSSSSAAGVFVDPQLSSDLDLIQYPAVFIDFEAINCALPPWPSTKPFGQIPVQVSMHLLESNGKVTHKYWLADNSEDPRQHLARFVYENVKNAASLVAYSAGFEKRAFRDLARFLPNEPEKAEFLCHAADNMYIDLLPIIRNNVYHPEFRGSFSLKSVLPALVPSLTYDELNVQGGLTAAIELERYILYPDEACDKDRRKIRAALLAYCEMDTFGLVELFKKLKELCGSQRTNAFEKIN